MGRFFLPNFVLLSFGFFNSIGFVGYLFVTEMMNCFVEPFPRFLDWFDVAANSVHPLSPICVVCLAQKLFLSLTSAFSVPLLILQRPRKQQRFSLLCHVWCCLLKLDNCFSSLFLRIESCTLHTVNLFQLVFGSTMWLSWIWSGKQSVFLLMVWRPRMWQRSSFSVHLCGDESLMMFVENCPLSTRSVFIDSKLHTVFLFHLRSLFRPRILVFFCFFALLNVSAAAQSKRFIWNFSIYSSPFHYHCIKPSKPNR